MSGWRSLQLAAAVARSRRL